MTPEGTYGAYHGKVYLFDHAQHVKDRPIYIMAVDASSQTPVDPNTETLIYNPNISTTITVPPETIYGDDGQLFSDNISVSAVPDEFTPGAMPDNLNPSFVVTIQPMGLTFDQPAPISFPNTDGLSPNSEVDIWSLNHETGEFFIAGRGRVRSDGTMIDTIEGGIRESSWHFPVPDAPDVEEGDSADGEHQDPGGCEFSSQISLHSGCLKTSIQTPAYVSLDQSRSLELMYQSSHAYPQTILPFNATISSRVTVPDIISSQINVGGVDQGVSAYIDTSTLSRFGTKILQGSILLDTHTYETGIYNYTTNVINHYDDARIGTSYEDRFTVINETDSPFGVGWDITGLSSLIIGEEQLLYKNGDGTVNVFDRAIDLRSWQQEGPTGNGNWDVASDGTSVFQTVNGDPTFFVSADEFINTTIQGTFEVQTTSDDDFIGFVFGYQSPHGSSDLNDFEFLLFDWKQDYQGASQPGFTLVDVDGIITDYDSTFWDHTSSPEFNVLATDYGDGKGWEDNTPYTFELTYNTDRLIIKVDDVVIFDVTGTFPAGRFGFFNHSQANVLYSDFQTTQEINRFVGPNGDYSHILRQPDDFYIRYHKHGEQELFSSDGLLTAVIDRNNNQTTFSYDPNTQNLTSITDPIGKVTTLTYSNGYLDDITDPNGRVTSFTHDTSGNLTRVTYPDGTSHRFGYDGRHLMTTETDQRGRTTTRTYDIHGRIASANLPGYPTRYTTNAQQIGLLDPARGIGSESNPAPAWLLQDVASTIVDEEGRTTTYVPGPLGRPANIIDPAGEQTRIDRDENGNPTYIRYPSGAQYENTYSDNGNLLQVYDRVVYGRTNFTYDGIYNQVTSIEDPYDNITLFDYDTSGNLTAVTSPLNRTSSYQYNGQGLVTQMTDPLGLQSNYTYDATGNLEQAQIGTGTTQRLTTFSYTNEGYVSSVQDALGRSSSFVYDELGRLTQETLPGDRTVVYGYDPAGNMTRLTPPGRSAHTFTYDDMGLLTAYQTPAVNNGGSNRTTYEYNNAQQLLKPPYLVAKPSSMGMMRQVV